MLGSKLIHVWIRVVPEINVSFLFDCRQLLLLPDWISVLSIELKWSQSVFMTYMIYSDWLAGKVHATLVQVMAWCCQATSHYLSQCWPKSVSPYGVTRPQWVNSLSSGGCGFFGVIFKCIVVFTFMSICSAISIEGMVQDHTDDKSTLLQLMKNNLLNSSPPSAAFMHHWIGPSLVWVMACQLLTAKPLP